MTSQMVGIGDGYLFIESDGHDRPYIEVTHMFTGMPRDMGGVILQSEADCEALINGLREAMREHGWGQ